MAHAGTTNGIDQPAATGSDRQAGLWIALVSGAVIVAIALAFVTTQGTGSRSVISAQRAPAVIVAPGAVTAPTLGPDWYARHVPAVVTAPTLGPDWYARHVPAVVTAPTLGPDWYARHVPATVATPTLGPDWYARHVPAIGPAESAAGAVSANADRNRHHRPLTPGQRLHR